MKEKIKEKISNNCFDHKKINFPLNFVTEKHAKSFILWIKILFTYKIKRSCDLHDTIYLSGRVDKRSWSRFINVTKKIETSTNLCLDLYSSS